MAEVKDLKEKLFRNQKNAYQILSEEEISKAYKYCEGYKEFLDDAKTEREAVSLTINMAIKNGFKEFVPGTKFNKGDKLFINNRGKAAAFVVIKDTDFEKGVNILAAHIDSPRLDLKPCPVYEEAELGLLKSHYYGGIRKYQWTALPLALHGVVVLKDGKCVTVKIGEDLDEPCFVVNDLLPHLAQEQSKRTLSQGIKGEELNVLIGSRPFKADEGSDLVKLNILNILFEKYGITESDFLSAELECVPALAARDIGFDKSLIGAYGHDDRVCAYPALTALFDSKSISKTTIVILADKEETGSDGNTGLNSSFLKYIVDDLCRPYKLSTTVALRNSSCLSADVNGAFDPTFQSVYDPKNSAYINYGAVITKYTGSGGKYGTSDASAEYMGKIRKILDNNNVIWQTGELGKVDEGGGGTVAKYIANLGADVVDLGVPVLSMHAPFETVSKIDVYMTYKASLAFIKEA